MQLHDYQIYAKEFIKNTPYSALWLEMGLGKCLDDNTVIPTPTGQKLAKNLKIGDTIYGKDGNIYYIEAVFKHKQKRAFKVTLKDGRSFICCDEHLIPFQSYGKAKTIQNKPLAQMIPDYHTITGQGYNKYKYRIPVADAVKYPEQKHVIHPYSLGVLIGDGCLRDTSLAISSIDEDVLKRFMVLQKIKNIKKNNSSHTWTFTNDQQATKVTQELKRLNLKNCYSKEKFIPQEYLFDSIENRKQLLIGLLDTDGNIHVSHKNEPNASHTISYSFSTMSEKLADNVCSLCWSLGFGAKKQKYYEKDGTLHDIRVGIGANEQLIFTERKTRGIEFKFNTTQTKHIPIVNIEEVSPRDMTCFKVSSPDELFLINDYIVTHNTSITLNALKDLNPNHHVLIVAPLNIARSTWLNEIRDWQIPFRTKSLIVNDKGNKLTKKKRYELYENIKNEPPTVYFINRDLISDLVDWSLSQKQRTWYFPIVVLDEAQSFKSYDSKRTQALMKVRPAISRLIQLTGTPTPKSIEDLWSQIFLLDQGQRLGKNITTFRDTFMYASKYMNNKPIDYSPKNGAEDEIYRRINNLVISMRNTVLELPDLIINKIPIELDPDEKKIYKEMFKHHVIEIDDKEIYAKNAGVLLLKLSQMASGAIYTDSNKEFAVIHTKKLDMTSYIIDQTPTPMLIAYHFKSDLSMLEERFKKEKRKYKVFDGKPQTIDKWNAGKIPILLIQPASAGHGLNLQKGPGHTMIWYTLPNSLEEYLQCNARLYRQGQTSNVIIHILSVNKTVDERLWESLLSKIKNQDKLMDSTNVDLKDASNQIKLVSDPFDIDPETLLQDLTNDYEQM